MSSLVWALVDRVDAQPWVPSAPIANVLTLNAHTAARLEASTCYTASQTPCVVLAVAMAAAMSLLQSTKPRGEPPNGCQATEHAREHHPSRRPIGHAAADTVQAHRAVDAPASFNTL